MEWKEMTQEQKVLSCNELIKTILDVIPNDTSKEVIINSFIDMLTIIGKQEKCIEEVKLSFLRRIAMKDICDL
jgi:hypothetical protein